MDTLLDIVDLQQMRGERHVLKGIDLTIEYGEIVGLIGKNGSGKSTLIKAISGEVQPRSGTMTLEGSTYRPRSTAEARAAGVSVIDQGFSLPPEQTVIRRMYTNTFMADWAEDDLLVRGREILERTDFDVDLRAVVRDLDSAEQSLVEVLRVLAEEAQLVIFDEVTALLNDQEIAQLHQAARRLRDQGCAIVHIAHRLEDVTALSDRVVVLREGRVVKEVSSREASADELILAMLDREATMRTTTHREHGRPVLRVHGLAVGDRVAGVDLSVHEGEVMGLIGLRRSGVNDLARALGGQVPASADRIEVDGADVETLEGEPRVAYVGAPTDETLQRSISEALTDGETGSVIERLRSAVRSVSALDLTTSNIQSRVKDLSGGDRQKVAVALGANTDARLVVFDHPTQGVDIGAKEHLHTVIDQLLDSDRAVVLLSVDLSELLTHCDRIAVCHDGRLVAVLDAREVHEDVVMGYAMTGERPEPRASRARRESAAQG